MTTERRCDTCQWWDRRETSRESRIGEDHYYYGWCRAAPPVHGKHETKPGEWCAHWTKREKEEDGDSVVENDEWDTEFEIDARDAQENEA